MIKEFKELQKENVRLKNIVANQAIDLDILKEVAKNFWPRRLADRRSLASVRSWGTANVKSVKLSIKTEARSGMY